MPVFSDTPGFGGSGGINLGGGGGNLGVGGVDWNSMVSTSTLDSVVFPVLNQAGDDPFQLAQLLPGVGLGHAPQSVGARVAAVAKITAAQRDHLGQLLSVAEGTKPKTTYSTSEVQTMLSTAFHQAGDAGARDLSDYLTTKVNQNVSQNPGLGTTTGGDHVIPAGRVQQHVYSADDIQAVIDAATSTTGSNLAQKTIGRNLTPSELQDVANIMNQNTAAQAQADAQGILSQQQSDIGTNNAINGVNANQVTPAPGQKYSFAQIEGFWIAAGGDPKMAPMMAATAMAESGGSNVQQQGENYQNTGWGLWQITPGNSESQFGTDNALLDPMANARAAVAKYQAQGVGAWTTITSGKYQQFMQQGVAPEMPSGGAASGMMSASAGYASPVGPGLKQGRTDEGVDFGGSGPVYAVGSGTILRISGGNSWGGSSGTAPGGTFIALRLDNPPDPQHSVVYYAEDITPGVQVGQHVTTGTQIGHANGTVGSGIEIGWADPSGAPQALAHGQGGATQPGQDFLNFIQNQTSNISGSYTNGSGSTDVFQQPIIDQVPANLDPAAAALEFMRTQRSTDYQSQNLLDVFSQIESSLKNPSVRNVAVQGSPVNMK